MARTSALNRPGGPASGVPKRARLADAGLPRETPWRPRSDLRPMGTALATCIHNDLSLAEGDECARTPRSGAYPGRVRHSRRRSHSRPGPRNPATATGRWRRATTPTRATAASMRSTPPTSGRLRPVLELPLGTDRGQEAAPLVVGDTMYIVAPYPNSLYALDLTKPVAAAEVELRSEARRAARRASPAATSSTAARPTPTGASSSTRSTGRPSRSTRPPARRCGAPSSATSTTARR